MYTHTVVKGSAPYFTHTIIDWWRKGTQLKISTVQAQYSYSHSFDSKTAARGEYKQALIGIITA